MTNYPEDQDGNGIGRQQFFDRERQKILDDEHLRLLVIGFYIMGGVVAFYSLIGLLYVFIGLAMAHFPGSFAPTPVAGSSSAHAAPGPDPRAFGAIFAAVGGVVVVITWIFSALTFLAGRSIARRRNFVFALVVAGLLCLSVPFGTALGVATFLVLNRRSVMPLFGLPTYDAAPAPVLTPPN